MFDELPFIGDWIKERSLGSGGFGTVILWKNSKTKEAVAVKKCNLLAKNETITDRQKERWQYEVQLMTTKIECDNIVKTINVEGLGDQFRLGLAKYNPSELPILVMEFCEGGDLRRLLSKNSNCSGLPEAEVRAILKALRNAISYLHDIRITHRDIKPENIVLKRQPDGGFVYKITDLGYAKQLDRQSLQASIVGTMEYLAPELLHSDKYSCSVDYWSFGLICFEICCGYRPFLPHASVARWMLNVKNKKSHHICITEDNSEGVQYHSEMFPETKLSSCLKEWLEQWLVLALEWNPKQRGYVFEAVQSGILKKDPNGDSPKSVSFGNSSAESADSAKGPVQVLKIFSMLDEILSKKVLTVFSLFTYKFLSFAISSPELQTIADLRKTISTACGIKPEELEFVLPCYQPVDRLDEATLLEDLFLPTEYEKPMIFVARQGMLLDRNVKPTIPKLLISIFENPVQSLKYHTVKQLASSAYYFMRQEQRTYITAMDGVNNYSLQLNHEIVQQKARMNLNVERVFEVKGALDVALNGLKRSRSVGISVDDLLEVAVQLAVNLTKLVEATRRIRTRYESVLKRSLEVVIENKRFFNGPQKELFNGNALNDQFDLVRHQLVEKMVNDKTHSALIKLTYNCLKERDIVLGDREFLNLQQYLLDLKRESDEIFKTIDKAILQVNKYKANVFDLSDSHQKRILGDLEPVMSSISRTPSSSAISAESIPRVIDFHIGEKATGTTGYTSSQFLSESDARSLIDENHTLLEALGSLIGVPTSEL